MRKVMQSVSDLATHDLGSLQAIYRASRLVAFLRTLGLILFPIGLIGFGSILFSTHRIITHPYTLLFLFCICIGLIFIAFWFCLHTLSLHIYERGIKYQQNWKSYHCLWEDIDMVWQFHTRYYFYLVHVATVYCYRVQSVQGKRLFLTNIVEHIEYVGEYIHSEVMQRLLPRQMNAFRNGHLLDFGRISVSVMGIHRKDEIALWRDIEAVDIVDNYLLIKKTSSRLPWMQISLAYVPNVVILRTIVHEMLS